MGIRVQNRIDPFFPHRPFPIQQRSFEKRYLELYIFLPQLENGLLLPRDDVNRSRLGQDKC